MILPAFFVFRVLTTSETLFIQHNNDYKFFTP